MVSSGGPNKNSPKSGTTFDDDCMACSGWNMCVSTGAWGMFGGKSLKSRTKDFEINEFMCELSD